MDAVNPLLGLLRGRHVAGDDQFEDVHGARLLSAAFVFVRESERRTGEGRPRLVIEANVLHASLTVGQHDLRIILVFRLVQTLELFKRQADLEGDGQLGGRRQRLAETDGAIGVKRLTVTGGIVRTHRKKRIRSQHLRTRTCFS